MNLLFSGFVKSDVQLLQINECFQ